jgi:tetratricopeptide (TPR) repeat protein
MLHKINIPDQIVKQCNFYVNFSNGEVISIKTIVKFTETFLKYKNQKSVMKKKPLITTLVVTCAIIVPIIIIVFFYSKRNPKDNYEFTTEKIRSLIAEGDSLRGSNQDSCIAVYNRAIEMAQSIEQNEITKHLAGLGYVGLAALKCNMGDYTGSSENVTLALQCADGFSDADIRAQAINIKGLLSFNQSKFDSAIVFYNQALVLAKDAGNLKLQGKLHTNFAIVKFYQGLCNEAIADFSHTLEIAEQLNDIDLITGTYINNKYHLCPQKTFTEAWEDSGEFIVDMNGIKKTN